MLNVIYIENGAVFMFRAAANLINKKKTPARAGGH